MILPLRLGIEGTTMQLSKIEAVIEAILFTMGEAVELEKLAKAIEHDEPTTNKLMNKLIHKYESECRGVKIIQIDTGYQMCTKETYYDFVKKVATKTQSIQLTDVLLETLSIIAYKQPITKAHIEQIRGVRSNHAVNKLIEYQLVSECGRLEAPGRPILFGTTEAFLRHFGFKSLGELPILKDEKLSEIKSEVEKEVQLKLQE